MMRYDNQRDKHTQRVGQRRDKRLEQKIHTGNKTGNDHNECRNTCTLLGIILRSSEITRLEHISTNVAQIPIPMPLNNEVETARVGHMPRI